MRNQGGFRDSREGLEGTVVFAHDVRALEKELEKGSKPSLTLPERGEGLMGLDMGRRRARCTEKARNLADL